MFLRSLAAVLVGGSTLIGAPASRATSVRQMTLANLCQSAERIYRGTVAEVRDGTIQAGGGLLATVTYRIEVRETLAGPVQAIVEFTTLGRRKSPPRAGAIPAPSLLDAPELRPGQEYLLFTTPPSRIGLSTVVGLGQGCFSIEKKDGKEFAVNQANNQGLGLAGSGPAEYQSLAARIRSLRTQ